MPNRLDATFFQLPEHSRTPDHRHAGVLSVSIFSFSLAVGCKPRHAVDPLGRCSVSLHRRFHILILSLGAMLLARPAAADSRWFWQNPLPQGNTLVGTAMVDANT